MSSSLKSVAFEELLFGREPSCVHQKKQEKLTLALSECLSVRTSIVDPGNI